MNATKSTPAYWKRFPYEILAKVKQLGIPTFFMKLSCADLHWNELIYIFSKLKEENLQEEHINNMDFFEQCTYLNINAVLLAQYRVGISSTELKYFSK